MPRTIRPCRAGRTTAALLLSLIIPVLLTGTAQAAPTPPALVVAASPAVDTVNPSPAGCTITNVDNPHPSDSVPGAVKVNAKTQCNTFVPELDLSVTLFGDGKVLAKTTTKAVNKKYLLNQSTYIRCTNTTDVHRFQGAAMGTSFEDGKPYVQIKFGPTVPLKCGY